MGVLVSSPRFVSTAFVPTDIAGCVLWLDADNSASITHSANAVSQWNDRSASGFNVSQGTSGAQPTTNTVTINSRNAISFDGGDLLNFTGATGLNVSAATAFVVGGETTAGDFAGFMAFHHTSGDDWGNDRAFVLTTGHGSNHLNAERAFDPPLGAGLVAGGGATPTDIWAGRFGTGGLCEAFRGSTGAGTSSTRSRTFDTAAGGVTIGGRYINGAVSVSQRLTGPIGEVVVYNSTLSDANLNTVGAYLAAKWGQTWTTI